MGTTHVPGNGRSAYAIPSHAPRKPIAPSSARAARGAVPSLAAAVASTKSRKRGSSEGSNARPALLLTGLAVLAGAVAHWAIVRDVWPAHGTSPGAGALVWIEAGILAAWLATAGILALIRYRGDWMLALLPIALVAASRSALFHAYSDPAYLPVGVSRAEAGRAKAQHAQRAAAERYSPERRRVVFADQPPALRAIPDPLAVQQAYAPRGAGSGASAASDASAAVNPATAHLSRSLPALLAPAALLLGFVFARRRRPLDPLDLVARRWLPLTFAVVFGALVAVRLLAGRSGRIGGRTLWELLLPALVVLWASALAADAASLARVRALLFGPRLRRLFLYGVLPVVPFFLTGTRLEPDFGTIGVVCASFALMLLVGTRQKWWGLMLPVWLAFCVAAYVAHPRVKERVDTWRDPYGARHSALGARHSALGARHSALPSSDGRVPSAENSYQRALFDLNLIEGGWTGAGPGRGHGEVAPNAADDGFATLFAAQFGFVGCLALVLLYALLLARGFRVASGERAIFERTLAVGLTMLVGAPFWTAFLGGVGALPLTGLSAAFVAHGGTKLLASAGAMGVLAALSERRETRSRE